ncbi:MAG: WYL domain-containing protein [Actinomycetota bacterium]|nr:WYL domain-containing protein [Actinomycetota bacterium]
MSARRAERLVNLVICLLSTRQFLSAERIRTAVPGYLPEDGTVQGDEAFKRMFERDKSELRELGVPLETGRNGWGDTEDGYRIARRDYELPDIDLTADEAAAVGLAARLWQSAGLSQDAAGALQKLRAAGIDVDSHARAGIQPRVEATDPAFEACLDAVRAGQPIRFDYRRPRAAAPVGREVEPWGVVSWHGRWYLVGHDRRRDAVRCFRLSRIDGAVRRTGRAGSVTVPDGVDVTAIVADSVAPDDQVATVLIEPGRAQGLRRDATPTGVQGPAGEEFEVRYADADALAARLIGFGSGVVAVAPPEVREAVVRRLQRIATGPDAAARPAR